MKKFSLLLLCVSSGMLSVSATGVIPENDVSEVVLPVVVSSDVSVDVSTATPDVAAVPMEGEERQTTLMKMKEEFKTTFKFGGYLTGRYNISDRRGTASNGGFDIRRFRLYGSGHAWRDFYYRFQLEVSDAPGTDRGPRVLDAFVEWQRHEFFRVKLGQFKRCFGFENPISPLSIGFGSYSQAANRLQSVSDRIGAHRSSGRDGGVQVQGDFWKTEAGHPLFHYQVGLYNGQGINHRDLNHHKDLIAGFWVSPLKELKIGAFGWEGRHTNENNRLQTIARHRYGLGVMYEADWTVRSEYVHSVGSTLKGGADRSDAWYAAVGVPVRGVEGLKIYGRWDCYRDNARTWGGMKTDWNLSANYWLGKNLLLQLNYTHTCDRSTPVGADRRYNVLDAQVTARF